MLRLVFTAFFGLLFLVSQGQLRKFYAIHEGSRFDTVKFTLEATAGNCLIRTSETPEGPLSIYGNPDLEKINPSFKSKIIDGKCIVDLDLQEFRSSNLGDGIVLAMLGSDKGQSNNWKILFDHDKIYDLNLSYGFGNANVDLSGTSVQNFKVKSGSADVTVGYSTGEANKIPMDTFFIKVDMGSIMARQLQQSRARYINANIGFGSATLDFGEHHINEKCTIDATVGAGSLDIYIPRDDTPVIIYMKDSPLCASKMPKDFREIDNNVYANSTFSADAENLLTFNVDVALGNISFYESAR